MAEAILILAGGLVVGVGIVVAALAISVRMGRAR